MTEEQQPIRNTAAEPPQQEITEESAKKTLREHLHLRAEALREKYENKINAETILKILNDPDALRYPVELHFRSEPLENDEFAYAYPIEGDPSGTYILCLHPYYKDKLGAWPALIAYHIPTINYGPVIGPDEAELFGATLLNMEIDAYYQLVCQLADAKTAEYGP